MKFFHPFGSGTIYITQTYHIGGSNKAIDLVWDTKTNRDGKVFAVGDGKVTTINPRYGSYIAIDLDNSNIRYLAVHTYRWTKRVGQTVKRGELIGYIAPPSVNGGFPKHLHAGLQWKSGKGYPNIMDYMPRDVTYATKYNDIKAEWFKNGKLNWSLFQDLSYTNTPNYKPGQNIVFLDTMNIRQAPAGKVIAQAVKNAVCTITGEGQFTHGYWWYPVSFAQVKGWVADTARNKTTTRAQTTVTGAKPADECRDTLKQVTAQRDTLQRQVVDLKKREAEWLNDRKLLRDASAVLGKITKY